ncbi:putative MULE transposase domain-containing protein [Helianthus annuus]|nr:putative MULE transposase domain-containing protein [Helianthus annuus]
MGGNLDLGSCGSKEERTKVGEDLVKAKCKAHGGTTQKEKGKTGSSDKVSKKPSVEEGSSVNKAVKKPKKRYPPAKCPWTLLISRKKKTEVWVVKTFINQHTCLHTRVVNLGTVGWLAKQIEPTIRINPGIPLRSLQDDLQKRFQVQVTGNQVFRAKKMATNKIQGDYVLQYSMLRDYSEELLRADPESTVKIDVEPEHNTSSSTRKFKRIYVCLGALKRGFKAGMRELIGLDGCFLKGQFTGQILTAVGADGNSGIYPVAYALVEAETHASWSWFLQLLGDDLGLASNTNFTFVSDRQKVIYIILNV